jgi:hypothetical protein
MRYLTCLIILFLIASAPPTQAQQVTHKKWVITMAGYKEIPRVSTSAAGTVTLRLKGDSLFVSGNFTDLSSNYKSAHIFYGADEEFGNAILTLHADFPSDLTSGHFAQKRNRFKLTAIQKQHLLDGDWYLAIASEQHPYGEIRSIIKR